MSDDIELIATEWKVSATEKISTGDYENYQPHVTLEGKIPVAAGSLDEDSRKELKARLLNLHKNLQEIIQQSAENRIAAENHEDWSL